MIACTVAMLFKCVLRLPLPESGTTAPLLLTVSPKYRTSSSIASCPGRVLLTYDPPMR